MRALSNLHYVLYWQILRGETHPYESDYDFNWEITLMGIEEIAYTLNLCEDTDRGYQGDASK